MSSRPGILMRYVLCCGGLALVLASPSFAFRPSSRWLVQQAVQAQLERKVETLRVEQEATLFGIPEAPRGLRANERTWLRNPGEIRNEIDLPAGTRVMLRTEKKQKVQEVDGSGRLDSDLPDVVSRFLAGGSPLGERELSQGILDDLRKLKVDLDRVSFGRFQGRVVYIVGAKAGELDKPQVWFDKDSLLLTRLVRQLPTPDSGENQRQDIRLLGYGSPEGGNWFPKVIEIWRNEELRKRSVTREVDRNQKLSKKLFQ